MFEHIDVSISVILMAFMPETPFYYVSADLPYSIFVLFSLQKDPKNRLSAQELMVYVNLAYVHIPRRILSFSC